MSSVNNKDVWEVVSSYFEDRGLIHHQLESYNDFVFNGIQRIVDATLPLNFHQEIKKDGNPTGKFKITNIKFGQVFFNKPDFNDLDGTTIKLYPQICRLRNLHYCSSMYISATKTEYIQDGDKITMVGNQEEDKIMIGRLPVMVNSNLCNLKGLSKEELAQLGEDLNEIGGYFIINGSEKAIVAQERLNLNQIFVFQDKDDTIYAEIKSIPTDQTRNPTKVYVKYITPQKTLKILDKKIFGVSLGVYFKANIPLFIVFKALGIVNQNDILKCILKDTKNVEEDDILEHTKEDGLAIKTAEDAMNEMGKYTSISLETREKRIEFIKHLLMKEFLPHVGITEDSFKKKAYFLGNMVYKIIQTILGKRELDDRDHFGNKRIDCSGAMLHLLFKQSFDKVVNEVRKICNTKIASNRPLNPTIVIETVDKDILTKDLKSCLATGNWNVNKKISTSRTGVAQTMSRLSYMATLSYLRRLTSPVAKEGGKNTKPRLLHNSQWGMVCVSPDTLVLKDDGSQTMIESLITDGVGKNNIIVINEETRKSESSGIVAFQQFDVKQLGKKVLKLKTDSGRSIIASEDHQFVRNGKFIACSDLSIGESVLIHPTPLSVPDLTLGHGKIILDKDDFSKAMINSNIIKSHTISKDITELINNNLLPLMDNDKRILTIARLIGYQITDGHTSKGTTEFYMGCEEDANELRNAALSVGSCCVPIPKKNDTKHINSKTKVITNYTTYRVYISGPLSRLLVALGAPIGNKQYTKYDVPPFVKSGTNAIKAAFLSGLYGGDGSTIWSSIENDPSRNKRRIKLRTTRLSMSKAIDNVDDHFNWMNNVSELLNNIGIETNKIIDSYNNEDNRVVLYFDIACNYENILRFIEIVGFRYCRQKHYKALLVSEFIRYCLQIINNKNELKIKARLMKKDGNSCKTIAKHLNVSHKAVEGWIRRIDNKTRLDNNINIDNYLEQTRADHLTGTLYSKITEITEITYNECPVVMDLTTASNVHTFVSNGFVTHNCPIESPDGKQCGYIKHLSMLASITIDTNPYLIHEYLINLLESFNDIQEMNDKVTVFLNGNIIGFIDNSSMEDLYRKLKRMKLNNVIPSDTAIVYKKIDNEIQIHTDGGRAYRPLLVVEEGTLLLNENHIKDLRDKKIDWKYLVSNGIVEYVDTNEEEQFLIALYPDEISKKKYTHCEIHPAMILSMMASMTPFPNHNMGTRNTYQSGQGKQAMGIYALNFQERMDTMGHILWYPQLPITSSKSRKYSGIDDYPAGINAIVAIACFSGYNVEDAVIMNKASLDRGMFRSSYYTTIEDVIGSSSSRTNYTEKFEKPNRELVEGIPKNKYFDHLSENGLPRVGYKMQPKQPLIGKTVLRRITTEDGERREVRTDASCCSNQDYEGIIDKVFMGTNEEGQAVAKVRLRETRIPELGDKFSSTHANKGTCGMIFKQEDMPFTAQGITPDIVINPASIPTRLSVAQLLECVFSKQGALDGEFKDATPFEEFTPEQVYQELKKHGFEEFGNEVMYNGITGEKMDAMIFIGPTYYQRLKHMVKDKFHSRSRGPLQSLIRQPAEGELIAQKWNVKVLLVYLY